MKIATRFPIAVHILLCIAYFQGKDRTTSEFIAGSVNVNPVVVRQVLQKLKAAGLVAVERGVGGASLATDPEEITLKDVFDAVDCIEGSLFGMHEAPNPDCPVGGAITSVLGSRLDAAQAALEAELASITLSDLLEEVREAK